VNQNDILENLHERTAKAVAHYWGTRFAQRKKQEQSGKADQGLRSAVTGGAQMNGFIDFFTGLITHSGILNRYVFRKKGVELPGFFRPTKEWDLLIVRDRTLIGALEAKSQVGPSFGNNFNNRTEEAIGSSLDLWTAFRERAYLESPQPFLGYFFMLEDCEASNHPVGGSRTPLQGISRVRWSIIHAPVRTILQKTCFGTSLHRRGFYYIDQS